MLDSHTADVLLLTLPRRAVIVPTGAHIIGLANARPDVSSFIATVYERAANFENRIDAVPIVCIPRCSPLIGPTGQLLIQNGEEPESGASWHETDEAERVDPSEFYGYGVAVKLAAINVIGSGQHSLLVEATGRVKLEKVTKQRPYFEGRVQYLTDEVDDDDHELGDLLTLLQSRSRELILGLRLSTVVTQSQEFPSFSWETIKHVGNAVLRSELRDAGTATDLMAGIVDASYEEKLQVLATIGVKSRVLKVVGLIERQLEGLKRALNGSPLGLSMRIITGLNNANVSRISVSPPPPPTTTTTTTSLKKSVPAGSGTSWEEPGEHNELDELRKQLTAAGLPPEGVRLALRELNRLQQMAPMNQEYQVIRNWLETLVEIPWTAVTDDRLDRETIRRARKQLDDDHYGLETVKKRLIEYLAVLRLKQSVNDEIDEEIRKQERAIDYEPVQTAQEPAVSGSGDRQQQALAAELATLKTKRMADKAPVILLFVGAPGTGKTSVAKSVAVALGRKFHRISLGGIRDEAEIRGHRRTYVAAMPGIIVQALRKVGVANPVILLDEIDKMTSSPVHGDPSAAMLEVLDPEQNHTFTDHYVGIPVDLSKALFIATANTVETIPEPLLDRMETIALHGYTNIEKRHIAMQHLVPKQIRANGLADSQIIFNREVVSKVIESYTREAGVRNLEREIGSVCRAKAVEFAEARDDDQVEKYRRQLTVADVEAILGVERYENELAETCSRPGVVTGLVAYSYGGAGSILFIEVAAMPGKGVRLTGQLGDVLKESVNVALSWVRAHAFELGLAEDPGVNITEGRSVHVHCPAGAVPKDGPSSGIGQAIALISLFSGRTVPPTMAMTGEISLRGRITAVGGIKEKLIGALRAGVKTVLLPAQNRKDVKDLPREVKEGIEIHPVSHIWEAARLVWPDWRRPHEPAFAGMESRL